MQYQRRIIAASLFAFAPVAGAADGSGVGTQAAIQTWHDLGTTVDGDTYTIDAGSWSWTSAALITKDVRIIGSGRSATTITRGANNITVFDLTIGENGFELAHMKLDANNTTGGIGDPVVSVSASAAATNNRIHHIDFENHDGRALVINTQNYEFWGVVDNCTFTTAHDPQDINILSGGAGNDATSWETYDSQFGTARYWFIEDCTCTHTVSKTDVFVDMFAGGKVVIRYCTIDGVNLGFHGTDSGDYISPIAWEVYANTFTYNNAANGFNARGGTGLVYDNSFDSASYNLLWLQSYRSDSSDGNWGKLDGNDADNAIPDGNETPSDGSGDGTHTGADGAPVLTDSGQDWTGAAWNSDSFGEAWYIRNITDGSGGFITAYTSTTITATLTGGTDNDWDTGDVYEITDGYPGVGQCGMGTKGGASYAAAAVKQPIFAWGNKRNGIGWNLTVATSQNDNRHIQEDRDFFNVADLAAANAHASFDADPTTAGNQDYAPYTYPHPLRGLRSRTPTAARKSAILAQ